MLPKKILDELEVVFQTQRDVLGRLDDEVARTERALSGADRRARQIEKLAGHLDDIESSAAQLTSDALSDFDPDSVREIYRGRRESVRAEVDLHQFESWETYVSACANYNLRRGLAVGSPFEVDLDEEQLDEPDRPAGPTDYRWKVEDFVAVGTAGALGAILDCLLVAIPEEISHGEFAGQTPSVLTGWLQNNFGNDVSPTGVFSGIADHLEKRCKTTYDAVHDPNGARIGGMSPITHRFQSLGHDPLLGFVFGVFDIYRGTVSGFEYDIPSGLHVPFSEAVDPERQVALIEALLKHIGHLISDVATPQGLPAPLATAFQLVNTGSIEINGRERTVAEVARWMYYNGYDFRHFLSSNVSSSTVELVLRAYVLLEVYARHGEVELSLASHPKYRSMLLGAHTIAAAGNAGKVALHEGNPLAVNQAQWMALFRYLMPSLRTWVFGREELSLEELQELTADDWKRLEESTVHLWETVAEREFPEVELGKEA